MAGGQLHILHLYTLAITSTEWHLNIYFRNSIVNNTNNFIKGLVSLAMYSSDIDRSTTLLLSSICIDHSDIDK